MIYKCFFLGHKWKTKYSTERKDLCECERCDAKSHNDKKNIYVDSEVRFRRKPRWSR